MVKKSKALGKKGGTKSSLLKSFKISRKVMAFLLIGIVAIIAIMFATKQVGADSTTKSCENTKGQCIEELGPIKDKTHADWKISVVDKKGNVLKGVKIKNTARAKSCYPAGYPNHPKGGCVFENVSFDEKTTEDSFGISLYKMDQKFFNNGVQYKTKEIYFPGFENPKDGVRSMWSYSMFQVIGKNGKVIGKVKASSPFLYTTNLGLAIDKIEKMNGKTFKIVVDSSKLEGATTSVAATAKTVKPATSSADTASKFNLVITQGDDPIRYSNMYSKRCAISVIAYRTSANPGKYEQKTASANCNSQGGYQNMEIRDIDPSILDGIVLKTTDTGGGGMWGKRQAINRISTKNILKEGDVISQWTGSTSSNRVKLSCTKGYDTVTCKYKVGLWAKDAD